MMYEWILIVALYAGPNAPPKLQVRRFYSLAACLQHTTPRTDGPGFSHDCIMVPKEQR